MVFVVKKSFVVLVPGVKDDRQGDEKDGIFSCQKELEKAGKFAQDLGQML
jgi:hypothetical protein